MTNTENLTDYQIYTIQLLASYAANMSINSIFNIKPRPRELVLSKLAPPHRQQYSVYVKNGNWTEDKPSMETWCSERFGPHNENYNNPRWVRDAFNFKFKNEKDAVMFMLRWG
jgi:hypothetical protein